MEDKGNAQTVFLAKDIAELIIKRYPTLSLHEVKSAMMSAEEFLLDSVYKMKKDEERGENNP